jgi:ubiquinone/menaquinone biosynthesis C-methylase UbiE
MDAKLQRRFQRYGWDKAAPYIACGTGLVTFPAAEAVGPSGSVIATDISAAMVTYVAAEASRQSIAHITTARMDAETLKFPDGTFDVALCGLGLRYVPDPLQAMRETLRVLKPEDASQPSSGARATAAGGQRSFRSSNHAWSRMSARCSSSSGPVNAWPRR